MFAVPIFDAREYFNGTKAGRFLYLSDLSDCPLMTTEPLKNSIVAVIHTVSTYFGRDDPDTTFLSLNPLALVLLSDTKARAELPPVA